MGCSPHSVHVVSHVKTKYVKTSSRKRCLTFGKFIGRNHRGTDADHLPVIPGNAFPAEVIRGRSPRFDTFSLCAVDIAL
jgi:hypothetical protein